MILLTWAMIRARRVQAITVFLMAAVAVGAAAASGAYIDAAQQRILADDVAAAPSTQKTITITDTVRLKAAEGEDIEQSALAASEDRGFEKSVPTLVKVDGFATAFSVRYPAFVANRGFVETDDSNGSVEFRENFCDHVVVLSGRCVSGPGEALISASRQAAGLGLSKTVITTPVRLVFDPREGPFWVPTDIASSLVVVGIYAPSDPADPYWGLTTRDFLTPGAEPVLTDRQSLAATAHPEEVQTVVAYARPDVFTLDRLAATGDQVNQVLVATKAFHGSSGFATLLSTVQHDRATAGLVAGVAAVPLIALCWYVLFLTITYTAQARRTELGMVKLRGVSSGDQWWIAATESLAPVLVGAVFGYLLGHLAVWAYARAVFGPLVSVTVTTQPLPYAVVALAGAVVAGLGAMRRDLASTATELLRRVPAARRGWRGLTLAVLVCAVAAVSVYQLRSSPAGDIASGQSGLGRFAPAMLIIGLALLCAVLVDPVMGWFGERALHRGRIGVALAGLHIGRRRSGARLLALVVMAVALLTFAATAAAFAAAERAEQAAIVVGADEVLSVSATSPFALLSAVRSVDPAGDYAMAAQPVITGSGGAKFLAVDSPRLATAAFWPAANGSLTAQAATSKLRPAVAEPVEIRGSALAVFAKVNPKKANFVIGLRVSVAQIDTGAVVRYPLKPPVSSGAPYTTTVACLAGCRLVDLRIVSLSEELRGFSPLGNVDPQVTIESVRQTDPDRELVSAADLAKWINRSLGALQTEAVPSGLLVTASSTPPMRGVALVPMDTPSSLPLLKAGTGNSSTVALDDGQQITTSIAGTVSVLPRLGAKGNLADLEYLLRNGNVVADGPLAEVWLGPSAPADIVQRLTKAGLTVKASVRLSDQLAAGETRPSAVGLRFLLIVALFGVALGGAGLVVTAGVERRTRSEELRALRIQGLSAGSAMRAALVGYVVLVGVAVLLGFLAGIAVWYATGDFLPIVDAGATATSLRQWPSTDAIVAAVLGGGILIAVAGAISVFLARSSNPSTAVRSERTSS